MRHNSLFCCAALYLGLMGVSCNAAELLSFGGGSRHFNRHLGYNEFNPGIGYERDIDKEWSWSAGVFKNSIRRASFYALGNYYPIKLSESWRIGVTGGLASGYHQAAVIPLVAPVLEWRGSKFAAQAFVVPTIKPHIDGAVVVQVKYILD